MFLLEDYLKKIQDPEQRIRVGKARESLIGSPSNTRWSDTFSLAGKKVRSIAVVGTRDVILGMDMILPVRESIPVKKNSGRRRK